MEVNPDLGTQRERENARIRRRLDRFKRAGLFSECSGLEISQARTVDDLRSAFKLVHDVFVQRGYVNPQPGGMRLALYEALPESSTFVAKAEGNVIAVMSIVPDSADLGLPSDKAFQKEIDQIRNMGRRVFETTNLAVDWNYRNSGVFLELVRACISHTIFRGYHDSFISISEGHSLFFESVMGFDPWGDRRNYGGDTVDFVEGKRLDLVNFERKTLNIDAAMGEGAFMHDWFFRVNPYTQHIARWDAEAQANFRDPRTLRQIFVEESNFLESCDDHVVAALRQRWGESLYEAVSAEKAQPAPAGAEAELAAAA